MTAHDGVKCHAAVCSGELTQLCATAATQPEHRVVSRRKSNCKRPAELEEHQYTVFQGCLASLTPEHLPDCKIQRRCQPEQQHNGGTAIQQDAMQLQTAVTFRPFRKVGTSGSRPLPFFKGGGQQRPGHHVPKLSVQVAPELLPPTTAGTVQGILMKPTDGKGSSGLPEFMQRMLLHKHLQKTPQGTGQQRQQQQRQQCQLGQHDPQALHLAVADTAAARRDAGAGMAADLQSQAPKAAEKSHVWHADLPNCGAATAVAATLQVH